MQPARRARVRLAVFVALAALMVASTGMTLAADRAGVRSAGRPAWDRRTDDAVRLVVTFKGKASRSDARAFERSAISLVKFEGAARRAVYQTTQTAVRSEKRRLERDPSIGTVQISHRLQRALDPEDEQYWDALWGLHNTGQTIEGSAGVADVDVDGRESLGVAGGTGVVVAVIDDGIDFSLPDLAGQAWVNPGESGGGKETNNVDDDANGYIDDVNGWDFCHDDKTVHDPERRLPRDARLRDDCGEARRSGHRRPRAGREAHGAQVPRRRPGLWLGRPGDRGHRVREVVRRADLEQLLGSTGERAAIR